MKKVSKKINLRNVSDKLSDKMLKLIIGGYMDYGDKSCGDSSSSSCNGLCPQYPKPQQCKQHNDGLGRIYCFCVSS